MEKKVAADGTPPYLPWSALTGFVARLKTSAIPSRIDRSVLAGMSGATQTQLRSGLKFLGLTSGDAHVPTEAFRDLVGAHGTDRWKATLCDVINKAFATIVEPLHMESDSMAQLVERFTDPGGVTGSVRIKAVRFYLAALDECGTPYSPHFKKGLSAASGTGAKTSKPGGAGTAPKKKKTSAAHDTGSAGSSQPGKRDEDTREIVVSMPSRDVRVWMPKDLTPSELKFVVDFLTRYQKLASEHTRAPKAEPAGAE